MKSLNELILSERLDEVLGLLLVGHGYRLTDPLCNPPTPLYNSDRCETLVQRSFAVEIFVMVGAVVRQTFKIPST